MLIDTHCHLSSRKFRDDLGKVIERAMDGDVEKIIVPSTNLEDAKKILEITKEYDGIYGLAGIYPGEAYKQSDWEADLEKIRELLMNQEKFVGIGEIGLDLYWDKRNIELEKQVFKRQLELAVELELPVVIHNRLAEKEIREVLENMDKLPKGHFHCWSGNKEFLEYVIEKGFYVGFCGNVTYPSNKKLQEMVKSVPINRLLLETDSPYLSPQGKRGKRNEPINVKITAEFLADSKGVSVTSLINETGDNAKSLFRI